MQNSPEIQNASNSLERRIDMAIARADVDKDVDQRLKRLARTVKVAGFRPGKVPFKMVVQMHGPQARHEAIGEAVERTFGESVRAQNLRVAGFPRIEPKPGEDESKLEFSAVFEVYPEITLGDISGQTIERPVLEAGVAEVDRTIEVLRKQRLYYVPTQRASATGDKMTVDFTGRLDGEVFQGGEAKDFAVVLGEGRMLPDFEAGLTGLAAGETRTFDVAFPDDYHAANLKGRTAQFEATVKAVEEPKLPELDAEFAHSLGIADGDIEKMRAEVGANLEREVKKRIQARIKEQAMKAILEANPMDVPRALVDQESRNMAEGARQDMINRGIDPKNVPVEPSWFTEQATRRVKLGLILADIIREKGIQATPEQVRGQIEEFAQSYEDPAEVVRWYYAQPQRLGEIEALVLENNVVDWVLANAQVTDKAVAFDELMGSAA
ncbi:MAG: trigger factor [Rhodocyclaceae bacterium]|nr:trigger factor [Rhodocyclaceae bacterium]